MSKASRNRNLKNPYTWRAPRTLLLLMYYQSHLLHRSKFGQIECAKFSELSTALNLRAIYIKEDLQALHEMGIILELEFRRNYFKLTLKPPVAFS